MKTEKLCQEINIFKRLSVKQKIRYIWDYYKWKIIVLLFCAITLITFINILWEGQKPCRLRVCVVLNTEDDCRFWFEHFEDSLGAKENAGNIEVNQDQPFDYDNPYYYLHEVEVMTTISSQRMDFAICNADMYQYLLALNACLPLEKCLPDELFNVLNSKDMLDYNTAGLTEDANRNINLADGIDGYYALDLDYTEFARIYNQTETGEEPLYAVIISNTENLEDCISLMKALAN